ncbi:MAG: polysaccharide deacetylase family protein [Lachnospiraceae bacterium]
MAKQDVDNLPENRRKRIKRLKKLIVGTVIAAIVIPVILCIFFGVRLHFVKKDLDNSRAQMEAMREELEQYSSEVEDSVLVEAPNNMQSATQNFDGEGSIINSRTTLTSTGNENANSSQDAETADGKKRVYLTFDDGPSDNTEEILDILKKYDVKATFFVVGNTSEHGQELLKRIVEEGHSIGIHSYSHKYSAIYDSEESFFEDFNKISDYIYDVTGVRTQICRLPGGSSNTVSKISMAELVRSLNEQNIECFDWNISGGDASGQKLSASAISNNVLKGIDRFQTAVVLLHDGADKDSTVEALDIVLKELTENDEIIIDKITENTPVILHISL